MIVDKQYPRNQAVSYEPPRALQASVPGFHRASETVVSILAVVGIFRLPRLGDLFDGTVHDYKARPGVVPRYRLHTHQVVGVAGADPLEPGRIPVRQMLGAWLDETVPIVVWRRVPWLLRQRVEHPLERRGIQGDLPLLCRLGAFLANEDLRMSVQVVCEGRGPALVATTDEEGPCFSRAFELVAEVLDISLVSVSYDQLGIWSVERTVMPVVGAILVRDRIYLKAYPTEYLLDVLVEVLEPAYEVNEQVAMVVRHVIQLVVRERVMDAILYLYLVRAVVDELFEGGAVIVHVPPKFVAIFWHRRYHAVPGD